MDTQPLLKDLVRANYHKGGLKCRRLFRLEPSFFATLRDDVRRLVEKYTPSSATDKDHATNWTNPYGTAVQFSLFNESGKLDDYSKDHNFVREGKRFHYGEEFPALGRFIETFKHSYNMRLNGMGTKSGLSPHEEHCVFPTPDKKQVQVRARFHLPIETSDAVEMLLDDEIFYFEPGSIFFFNNGCIHSATNNGTTFRYHLVWDQVMTQESYDQMFGDVDPGPGADFLQRLHGEDAVCRPVRRQKIREYAISGPGESLYSRMRLKYLKVKPYVWQNLYNNLEYRKVRDKPVAWWQMADTIRAYDDPDH